jgi:hypothetical protein
LTRTADGNCPEDRFAAQKILSFRIQFDQPLPYGKNGGLCPIIDLQFMEDISNVILHGLFTEVETVGDLFVGFSIRDEP